MIVETDVLISAGTEPVSFFQFLSFQYPVHLIISLYSLFVLC